MADFISEYLVRIGFSTDDQSFRKFQGVLADADRAIATHVTGTAKYVLAAETAIIGAFTGVSAAIISSADHIAMADQRYRLLGASMATTTEAARKWSIITRELNATPGEIFWDPSGELGQRANQLWKEQTEMAAAQGKDFEKNLRQIRDIHFEFSRLGGAMERLAGSFAVDLWTKLGIDPKKNPLKSFVDDFEAGIPGLSTQLSTMAVPVLRDTKDMMFSLGEMSKQTATLFTNTVGILIERQISGGRQFLVGEAGRRDRQDRTRPKDRFRLDRGRRKISPTFLNRGFIDRRQH